MQIAPILIIVYVKRTKSKMPYLIHQLGLKLPIYCFWLQQEIR